MLVVFFLEEPSAKALLQGLLPRLLPANAEVQYVVFQGKQDLERNLSRKLRFWRRPDARFVVLRDQDSADCRKVKARLAALVRESGREALVRVACRELESWVLGDLAALSTVYRQPKLGGHGTKAKYRNPDTLGAPVEELKKLVESYQKIDGARRLGSHLDPVTNTSPSFRAFCDGVHRLTHST